MRDIRSLVRQHVASLHLSADREQKIVEEWAAQLEDHYDALRAAGASDEDAWRDVERQMAAAAALGGHLLDGAPLGRLTADPRLPRAGRALRAVAATLHALFATGLLRDLRTGVRLLGASPGFSATVVLTLAVCLGANAAIFTVIDAVILRPLPIPESDRVVGMGDVYPTITPNDILSNDVPSYFDRRAALTALEEQGLFTYWFDTVTLDGVPRELRGMKATPSLFRVLRTAPALGRTFLDEEGESGRDLKIILSHALWQRLYGGDPGVIGRSLRLGWTGSLYTIVGVMPREFSFFEQGYDGHDTTAQGIQFWLPLSFTPEQKADGARTRYGFFHVGRLRPGATVGEVQAQLDALHAANVARFPQFRFTELGMYSAVTPLQEALTRRIRRPLYLLWAGAGFVLIIGAINLVNLALARATTRRRELATRLALGAGRLQVARQLVVEALVPALAGGIAALGVAAALLRALIAGGLATLPNTGGVGISTTAIAAIAAAALAVGVVMGLVPAIAAGALTVSRALADDNRFGTSSRGTRAFRRLLVATQVGLSVVLLIGATLLFTSFRYLLSLDAGFRGDGVVTATVFPPPSRYPTAQAMIDLQDRVLERVRRIPAVAAAGMTSNIALSGFESPAVVTVAGRAPSAREAVVPSIVAVTPGYFEAMETPIVAGRGFDGRDRERSQRVAIVDERLASRLFPGQDPLGSAIVRGEGDPYTIVGVVRDVRFEGLTTSIDAIGTAYFPHTQTPPQRRLRWIAIRSAVDAADVVSALRAALVEIDPDLPIADVQTMNERTANALVPQRLAMSLAALFAVVALALSMLGLYGVLVSLVATRTREIGIRLALGSTLAGVLRLVVAEGLLLIGAGLSSGVAAAVATARTLQGLVFGVQPTDPVVLAGVTIATGTIALLACIAPARRAARVNPVDVLSNP